MKKITFNTLPEAISELIVRIDKIERILSRRTSRSDEKVDGRKKTRKRQEAPAGALGIKEAAKLLKMSVINLYSYVKNKKIPFEKRGRRLFFSKNALENWMKARNQQITPDHITIKDAEKLLKVSATTIYYKIRSQKLKPAARRGNKLYFSKKELINAFTKPAKRGRKALKAGKPAKAKTAKPVKAAKAVKAKKAPKAIKRGRPAKPVAKQEGNGSKPAQPAKAAKPAPAKATKPAPAKSAKPAASKTEKPAAAKASKPVAPKAAKKAKPKKAKAAKPTAKPAKNVQPTPSPASEPQKPEMAPETPAQQNGNQQPENGSKE